MFLTGRNFVGINIEYRINLFLTSRMSQNSNNIEYPNIYHINKKLINMFMLVWMIEGLIFHHTNVGQEAQTTSNIQIYKNMMPNYLFILNYYYYLILLIYKIHTIHNHIKQ